MNKVNTVYKIYNTVQFILMYHMHQITVLSCNIPFTVSMGYCNTEGVGGYTDGGEGCFLPLTLWGMVGLGPSTEEE